MTHNPFDDMPSVQKPRGVSITFSKEELWELMNNFDMSFMSGEEGNELATRVSLKLHKAYRKLT